MANKEVLTVIAHVRITDHSLLGIGMYTPAEAGRLTAVPSSKIRRWLRGHSLGRKHYERLWQPQIDIGDDEVYLGFRDLIEVRVVDAFIRAGLSAQKIRRAIAIAQDRYGIDHPLSTHQFRTDGRNVFLLLADEDQDRIVDLFRNQYAIRQVLEPSFKGLEYGPGGVPVRWRVSPGVVIDPEHAFGQPVDRDSLVPTAVLADGAAAEGSPGAAAIAFDVPVQAVKRAIAFERSLAHSKAA